MVINISILIVRKGVKLILLVNDKKNSERITTENNGRRDGNFVL